VETSPNWASYTLILHSSTRFFIFKHFDIKSLFINSFSESLNSPPLLNQRKTFCLFQFDIPYFGRTTARINRIKLMNFKQLGYCFFAYPTNCFKMTCSLIILNWLLNLSIWFSNTIAIWFYFYVPMLSNCFRDVILFFHRERRLRCIHIEKTKLL
jgi:hypothetical protein